MRACDVKKYDARDARVRVDGYTDTHRARASRMHECMKHRETHEMNECVRARTNRDASSVIVRPFVVPRANSIVSLVVARRRARRSSLVGRRRRVDARDRAWTHTTNHES